MDKVSETRIPSLLDEIRLDFPRKKQVVESMLKPLLIEPMLELQIDSPEVLQDIPTFYSEMSRPLSPMLRDRFRYAGEIEYLNSTWVSINSMSKCIIDNNIQENHHARREYWTNSAPMLFGDDRLGLFGISPALPEDALYFVWVEDDKEPEIWCYTGLEANRFPNLEKYFEWCLDPDE